MFRNALRQSTRAVGAVSAAGRVAAVSRLPYPRARSIFIKKIGVSISATSNGILNASIGTLEVVTTMWSSFFEASWCSVAVVLNWRSSHFRASANFFFPTCLDPKCRPRRYCRVDPVQDLRRGQGITNRGLFYSRAADPWCSGRVWSR